MTGLMETPRVTHRYPLLCWNRALVTATFSAFPELRRRSRRRQSLHGSVVQTNDAWNSGDSVLELLTSEYLLFELSRVDRRPAFKSRARALVTPTPVNRRPWAQRATLRLPRREEKPRPRQACSLLAVR